MTFLCLYVCAQVGSLDLTFNASGTKGYRIDNPTGFPDKYDEASAIAFTSGGKILVAGRVSNDNNFLLLRYTAAGALDNTFGNGGVVWVDTVTAQGYGMALQQDGKIVMAGWIMPTPGHRDFCVMRFNSDGSLDLPFGTNGIVTTPIGTENDEARNVAIQSDGNIVVTGYSTNAAHNTDFAVVRYTSSGSLDGSFGSGGIVTTNINNFDVANSIAINNTTGTITIAGSSNEDSEDPNYSHAGSGDFTVVRYTSAGALDGTFGAGGKAIFDINSSYDEAHSMAVQPDGQLIVAGIAKRQSSNGGNSDVAVIRVTTIGGLDGTFGTSGKVIANYSGFNSDDDCQSVALQSDGKIIIGGSVDAISSSTAYMMMRFTTAGAFDVNFDGDGKAAVDIAPTDDDKVYAIALNANRIYLAGYSGAPKDFAIAAFQNDGTSLPIVLTQFYGQKQTNKVVLQWTTSMEENVAQYVIERSSDGKTYKAIGTVAATGNSSLTKNYSFADQSPFINANDYYRLLVQDVSGSVTYSKVLIINFSTELTTNLQIFPNPVKNVLQVQIPGGFKGSTSLQVFDLSGHLVKVNRINSDGNALNTTIDITTLPIGVYMLKATDGNTSLSSRFVKQ